MTRQCLAILLFPALAACASTDGAGPGTGMDSGEVAATCDASLAQDHIGHRASAEAGQILLTVTGARSLRWAPPHSVITMDYRADRLTVRYDDEMVIKSIACG